MQMERLFLKMRKFQFTNVNYNFGLMMKFIIPFPEGNKIYFDIARRSLSPYKAKGRD